MAPARPKASVYENQVGVLPPLSAKVVAVTGAGHDLGYWCAHAAATKGPACLLLLGWPADAVQRAEDELLEVAVPGSEIMAVPCDLLSFASVRAAAKVVAERAEHYGGLDVLACAADAVMAPDVRSADGLEHSMQANHLSHFLLTKLLLPYLEMAAASRGEARAVQQTSAVRRLGSRKLSARYFAHGLGAGTLDGNAIGGCHRRYQQACLARTIFFLALHEKLKAMGSKVKCLCADPGCCKTGALGRSGERDGACSLLAACFLDEGSSGDFYRPMRLKGPPILNGRYGYPVKCWEEGEPLVDLVGEERNVRMEDARALLWRQSEAAIGEAFHPSPPTRDLCFEGDEARFLRGKEKEERRAGMARGSRDLDAV